MNSLAIAVTVALVVGLAVGLLMAQNRERFDLVAQRRDA